MAHRLDGIRAVAFDLDGTLVDTVPDLESAANTMLGLLGAPLLAPGRVRMLVGDGISALVQRVLHESLGERPIAASAQARALELFRDLYRQRLFHGSELYPQVETVLPALARSGRTLGCITNKDSALALPLLQAAGLMRWIEFCLTPESADQRKPSPYLLQLATQQLQVSPAQLLYVGDMANDMAAARAAGCAFVAVSYGYHRGAPLEELYPGAVIDRLEQLLA